MGTSREVSLSGGGGPRVGTDSEAEVGVSVAVSRGVDVGRGVDVEVGGGSGVHVGGGGNVAGAGGLIRIGPIKPMIMLSATTAVIT
jgi:hypothetical protein